jgi:hypothetical protein
VAGGQFGSAAVGALGDYAVGSFAAYSRQTQQLFFAGLVYIERLAAIPSFSHALSQCLRVLLDIRRGLRGILSHFVRAGFLRSASDYDEKGRDNKWGNYFHDPTMRVQSARLVSAIGDNVIARQDKHQLAASG